MSSSAHIYHSIVQTYGPQIQEEQERYESIQKAKAPYSPWLWGVVGWVVGIAIGHTWIYGVGGVVIMLIIISLFRPKYTKNYTLASKISNHVIKESSKEYFSKSSFEYFDGMSEEEFVSLFNQECDDYSSDSLFKGVHHDLKFRICNVQGSYEEEYDEDYTDSDGNTYTETHTRTVDIFDGSILRITLPHPLKSSISLGNFRSKEVMDHQKFNQYFRVSSYDRVYTRYVLTQSFMDNLVNLVYLLGRAPAIEFDGKFIYVMMDQKITLDDIGFFSIESDIMVISQEIKRISQLLETIAFYDHHIINNQDKGEHFHVA